MEVKCEEGLKDCLVPKTMIQPLVENAILHGILPTEASGKIWIIIQKQGGKLCVMVKDEGIGVSKEQLKRFKQGETMAENKTRKHIGVENVRDRIRYLYGEGFGMEIQSTQGKGTTVILTLPVKRAEEKKDENEKNRKDSDSDVFDRRSDDRMSEKSKPWFYRKKEQKEEATETESKNKETQEISFDEELPKDYEGTLTMWGWDTDYYQTVTQAFQEIYPNVTFEYTSVEHKDLPQKYETALIVGGELPDIAWSVIDFRGEVFELDMWEPLEQEPYNFRLSEVCEYLHPHMVNSKGNVCGIEQSLSPAGLAYRRDLAKNISVRTTRKSWRR